MVCPFSHKRQKRPSLNGITVEVHLSFWERYKLFEITKIFNFRREVR